MKQILDYLKIEKLGAPVLPPFEKFEGLMSAKVLRRNSESFVVAKWNDDFLTPDVAFDPNANFGMVDEFLELYSNEEVVSETIEDEPDGNFEITDNEEVDGELGGEELEMDLLLVPEEDVAEVIEPSTTEVEDIELSEPLLSPSIFVSGRNFPVFEALKGDELSEWLLSHSISHKSTLSKPEKVKLCEKYVANLAKSE